MQLIYLCFSKWLEVPILNYIKNMKVMKNSKTDRHKKTNFSIVIQLLTSIQKFVAEFQQVHFTKTFNKMLFFKKGNVLKENMFLMRFSVTSSKHRKENKARFNDIIMIQYIIKLIQFIMMEICYHEKTNIASFITKTFKILNTPQYNNIICWAEDGKSIKIFDFKALEDRVLEVEFRHKNHSSFVRQLNMYGFRKIRKSTEYSYFFHPLFNRNSENLLSSIKRNKFTRKCLLSEDQEEMQDEEHKKKLSKQIQKLKSSDRSTILEILGIKKFKSAFFSLSNTPDLDQQQQPNQGKNFKINKLKKSKSMQRRTSINIEEQVKNKSLIKFEELDKLNKIMETQISLKQKETIHNTKSVIFNQSQKTNKNLSQRTLENGVPLFRSRSQQFNRLSTSSNDCLLRPQILGHCNSVVYYGSPIGIQPFLQYQEPIPLKFLSQSYRGQMFQYPVTYSFQQFPNFEPKCYNSNQSYFSMI